MSGRLIVLEGLDGSGKTTQAALLEEKLKRKETSFLRVSFPDYKEESSALVRMYLGGAFGSKPESVNAYAASSFYAVDRYASYKRFWEEKYQNGTVVLTDRYTTSNAIYQMVKLPRTQWEEYLSWLAEYEYVKLGLPAPDQVIYFDMPPDTSQKLLSRRYEGDESRKDIHESHVEFLKQCREAALFAAQRWGWETICCTQGERVKTVEEIAAQVAKAVFKEELFD